MIITIENQTNSLLPIQKLEEIASSLTQREIELIICDDETICKINQNHRGINKSTDVLSFPLESDFDFTPLGSIIISSDQARHKADLYGHTAQEESILLFIHGLLHLLGYDHEVDDGQMRREEERIITVYNLPTSLIVRTINQ